MRTKIIALGVIASLVAGTAAAENASKEENIATGSGLIVGAVAGGPVGALVGVVVGAKLGEKYRDRREESESLQSDLQHSQLTLRELESELQVANESSARLEQQLDQIQRVAQPELVSLLKAGIEMDLLFRTDEHVLNGATDQRLQAMASTLAPMSSISIRLDGYADERGDAEYNLKLSQLRAEHVRDILVGSGIPAERIKMNANGESAAAEQNVDSYALERKVSLTVLVEDSPSFAANPVN